LAAAESFLVTDPGNEVRRTSQTYDNADRNIATTNPLGKRWSTVFDAGGRRIAQIDALGNRTTTIFDRADEPIAIVNSLGKILYLPPRSVGANTAFQ
jgi:YD repeat-containing protein